MKLGILGKGKIVQDLMDVFHEFDIEKAYVLGRNKEETDEFVEEYNLHRAYYDYEELLNSDIDTIYCALPNHLHHSFCKKALENGKHVIIEKPITSNVRELEELIKISKEKNLMIFEAVNLHYLPSYISLKQDLDKLGKIKIVSFNYSQYSSRYDAFKEGNILHAFDYHKSGGALMDINVYNINALIGLFGKPLDNHYYANIENNIDVSGIMMFDYGSFKATAIGAKDCKAPITNTIQGDEASIFVNTPLSQMTEYTINYNDGRSEIKRFENKHRLSYEFKEFINMINNKDYKRQEAMLQLSLEIAKVIEKGRIQEGIVFDNDKR